MPSVLSIQSHVVHGYVGNRAATFPLQYQGWDVDALNTVHFSNHTGYGKFGGTRATQDDISTIYGHLKELEFHYDALLTGYTPGADAVAKVGEIGSDLKERFPDLIWQLDPVLGDEGQLYVPKEVIPVYKSIMQTGQVTLITPNWFEVETLTGITLDSKDAIKQALKVMHTEFKVPNIIITSVKTGDKLWTVGSAVGSTPFYYEQTPIKSYFTGTGDLFASLILAGFYKSRDLRVTVGEALYKARKVLADTFEHSKQFMNEGAQRGDFEKLRHLELRIIPCRKVFDEEGSYGEAHEL